MFDASSCLRDFYLLHHAWERLQTDEVQWYWPGATKDNIDDIIRDRAIEFVKAAGSLHAASL
jgi:hypothetical protein